MTSKRNFAIGDVVVFKDPADEKDPIRYVVTGFGKSGYVECRSLGVGWIQGAPGDALELFEDRAERIRAHREKFRAVISEARQQYVDECANDNHDPGCTCGAGLNMGEEHPVVSKSDLKLELQSALVERDAAREEVARMEQERAVAQDELVRSEALRVQEKDSATRRITNQRRELRALNGAVLIRNLRIDDLHNRFSDARRSYKEAVTRLAAEKETLRQENRRLEAEAAEQKRNRFWKRLW